MIRVGIGGWTFEPWRGAFYPEGLKHAEELSLCEPPPHHHRDQRHLLSHPVGGELRQMAGRDAGGFRLRGEGPPRHRQQQEARRIGRGGRLVPEEWRRRAWRRSSVRSLWQLAPLKKFDAEDLAGFLALLPREAGGRPPCMSVEVRHESFLVPEFVALAPQAQRRTWSRRLRPLPGDRRRHRRFRLCPSAAVSGGKATGYSAADLDAWTGAPGNGRRRRAGRPAPVRRQAGDQEEAAGVRLHDQRSQGAGPRRRHGAHREIGASAGRRITKRLRR